MTKSSVRLLCEKLDDAAKENIVGLEDKYSEAMECLKAFYGDPCRVVECVMQEVKGPGVIADDGYQSLVGYSDTLARNFNRPQSAEEKWQAHLARHQLKSNLYTSPFTLAIQ